MGRRAPVRRLRVACRLLAPWRPSAPWSRDWWRAPGAGRRRVLAAAQCPV